MTTNGHFICPMSGLSSYGAINMESVKQKSFTGTDKTLGK